MRHFFERIGLKWGPRKGADTTVRAGAVSNVMVTDLAQLGDGIKSQYRLVAHRSNGAYVLLRNAENSQRILLCLPSVLDDQATLTEMVNIAGLEAKSHEFEVFTVTPNVLNAVRTDVKRDSDESNQGLQVEEGAHGWRDFQAMVQLAYQRGASDIHIETDNDSAVVLVRVDGEVRRLLDHDGTGPRLHGFSLEPNALNYPHKMHVILKSAYQHAVAGTTSDNNLPIGRDASSADNANCQISVQVEKDRTTREVRLRFECSTTDPMPNGTDTVIRIAAQDAMDPKKMDPDPVVELMKLGALRPQAIDLVRAVSQGEGGVLIGGPTGQGKTRTLYTLMAYVAKGVEKTLTLEDPVEGKIYNTRQISVTPPKGVSEEDAFNNHFKSAMRRDPDHILIGEIRDKATASAFIQACITGHLGLGSTHSKNVVATFDRLSFAPISIAIENLTSPDVFNVVGHQLLVQRLCPHCKQPASTHLPAEDRKVIEKIGDIERVWVRNHQGCSHCRGRTPGVQGRTACMEIVIPHDELFEVLRKRDFTGAHRLQRDLWRKGDLRDDFIRDDPTGKTAMDIAIYKMFGGDADDGRGYVDYHNIRTAMKDFDFHLRRLGVSV